MGAARSSTADVLDLLDGLRAELASCASLESAAQRAAEVVYEGLSGTAVLVRVFVALPYEALTPALKDAARVARSNSSGQAALSDHSPVLTLLGTRGSEASWNDRRLSLGHACIPLTSADVVESIPMVARLLHEIGIDSRWFEGQDLTHVERKLAGGVAGFFYVADAHTARDARGRRIIPAERFVEEHSVTTVFGLGGVYATGTLFTIVIFTREHWEKAFLERYLPLVSCLKAATAGMVSEGRFFERE